VIYARSISPVYRDTTFTPAGPADSYNPAYNAPDDDVEKIQRAKRAEERGRQEFGELSDRCGVSFALSLTIHHPLPHHNFSTTPTQSMCTVVMHPKRTIPCSPRSEAFSCFCLSRNLSFPVAISWTTYSDTFADQTLRSFRNFPNFEGGRSRDELCLQCLDWLCAGRMKMNTLRQCDCSRQLFTFVWCYPRRQFPVIYRWFEKLMWDASSIIWHNWQNFAFDPRRKRACFIVVSARIWSLPNYG